MRPQAAINTGIPKVGSIGEVRKIAELCEMNGIRCALSNTAGSMVGDAAALHLAVSTPGIAPLCELGEFEVITGDPFFGLTVDKGSDRRAGGRGARGEFAGLLDNWSNGVVEYWSDGLRISQHSSTPLLQHSGVISEEGGRDYGQG